MREEEAAEEVADADEMAPEVASPSEMEPGPAEPSRAQTGSHAGTEGPRKRPWSLVDQVGSAVKGHAAQHLRGMFEQEGLAWDQEAAGKITRTAWKQILSSMVDRGEKEYSLTKPGGEPHRR